jgi:hypothetical protein
MNWVEKTVTVNFYNVSALVSTITYTIYISGSTFTINPQVFPATNDPAIEDVDLTFFGEYVVYTETSTTTCLLMPIDMFFTGFVNVDISNYLAINPTHTYTVSSNSVFSIVDTFSAIPYNHLKHPTASAWVYDVNPSILPTPTAGFWVAVAGDFDGKSYLSADLPATTTAVVDAFMYRYAGISFYGTGSAKRLNAVFSTGYGFNTIIDILNGNTRIDNYTRGSSPVFFEGNNDGLYSYVSGWSYPTLNSLNSSTINYPSHNGSLCFSVSHQVYDGGSLDRHSANGVEISDGWFLRTVGNTYGVSSLLISLSGNLFSKTKKGKIIKAEVLYDVWVNETLSEYNSAVDNPVTNPAGWTAMPLSTIAIQHGTETPFGKTYFISFPVPPPFIQIAIRRKTPLDLDADKYRVENISVENIIAINDQESTYVGQSLRAVHLYEQAGKNVGGSEVRLLQKSDGFILVDDIAEPLLNQYVPTGNIRLKWGYQRYNMASAILQFILGYYVPKTTDVYLSSFSALNPFGLKNLRIGKSDSEFLLCAGVGANWDEINWTSFYNYQTYCIANKLSFDGMWSPDGSREDALKELALYGICDISLVNGLWTVRPVLRTLDIDAKVITLDDIKEISYSCEYPENTPRVFTGNYQSDAGLWTKRILTFRSLIPNANGELDVTDLPMCSDLGHAQKILSVKKWALYLGARKVSIKTSRIAKGWSKGDHLRIPAQGVQRFRLARCTYTANAGFDLSLPMGTPITSNEFSGFVLPDGLFKTALLDEDYPYYYYNLDTNRLEVNLLSNYPDSCAWDYSMELKYDVSYLAEHVIESVSSDDGINYDVLASPKIYSDIQTNYATERLNDLRYRWDAVDKIQIKYSKNTDTLMIWYDSSAYIRGINPTYVDLFYGNSSVKTGVGAIPLTGSIVKLDASNIPNLTTLYARVAGSTLNTFNYIAIGTVNKSSCFYLQS